MLGLTREIGAMATAVYVWACEGKSTPKGSLRPFSGGGSDGFVERWAGFETGANLHYFKNATVLDVVERFSRYFLEAHTLEISPLGMATLGFLG